MLKTSSDKAGASTVKKHFDYTYPPIRRLATRCLPVFDYAKIVCSGVNTVVHGSYYTTNVGDRAIGLALRNELKRLGVRSVLTSRFCRRPPVRNVVVGGGGVIHNNYDGNLSLRTDFVDGTRNVVYAGVGCPGFAPLSQDDERALSKMRKARYVSVRDSSSRDILTSVVDVTPEVLSCPAWLLRRNLDQSDPSPISWLFTTYYNLRYRRGLSSHLPSDATERERIGVVPNGLLDIRWWPQLRRLLHRLSKEADLWFVPFAGKDIEFCQRELSGVQAECCPLQGPIGTFRTIMAMDKVVAARYHSLIFATLAGRPVMIVPYSQKMVSLARDLNLTMVEFGSSAEDAAFNMRFDEALVDEKIKKAETLVRRIVEHLE